MARLIITIDQNTPNIRTYCLDSISNPLFARARLQIERTTNVPWDIMEDDFAEEIELVIHEPVYVEHGVLESAH